MTQILEKIAVAIAFGNDEDSCPFSHAAAKDEPKKKNEWTNDSSKLDGNLAKSSKVHLPHRDTGKIRVGGKHKNEGKIRELTYNAHHLLPGDDCWPKTKLKQWIDKEPGKVRDDIGYDVNCSENGIDLPSSKAMQGKWKISDGVSPGFQKDYAFAAIEAERTIRQFHDSHKPYSAFATKTLDKIADKLEATPSRDMGCGHKHCNPGKKAPFETPVHLLPRIHGVSKRLARHLYGGPAHWRVPIMTSKFSLMYKEQRTAEQAKATLKAALGDVKKMK